ETMTAILVSWGISAAVLVVLALAIGWFTGKKGQRHAFAVLIDFRGRYSLTHFQIVLWTLVILSLVSGVFFGRLVHNVPNPLGFKVPANVLGLLGISFASAVTATSVKVAKDQTRLREA